MLVVAAGSSSEPALAWIAGDGTGDFGPLHSVEGPPGGANAAAVADVTRDGIGDLLVSSGDSDFTDLFLLTGLRQRVQKCTGSTLHPRQSVRQRHRLDRGRAHQVG